MTVPSFWIFKARVGEFYVWHAGKNTYHVTIGRKGGLVGTREQFRLAVNLASHSHETTTAPA